jgi:hypothetical protein
MMPLCPHTNTRFFDKQGDDKFWIEGTKELLRRANAAICVEGWEKSEGSKGEVEECRRLGKPVFFNMKDLLAWHAFTHSFWNGSQYVTSPIRGVASTPYNSRNWTGYKAVDFPGLYSHTHQPPVKASTPLTARQLGKRYLNGDWYISQVTDENNCDSFTSATETPTPLVSRDLAKKEAHSFARERFRCGRRDSPWFSILESKKDQAFQILTDRGIITEQTSLRTDDACIAIFVSEVEAEFARLLRGSC